MRYCKQFFCNKAREWTCCPTCWLRRNCTKACLNHPALCGLEDIERANEMHKGRTRVKFCKRFYCDVVGNRVCCSTCWLQKDCARACLNHPVRCGLEDKEYTPPRRRGGHGKLNPKK